ncbi:MAG: GrpB family protein [Culicoidibacterales bacterium]
MELVYANQQFSDEFKKHSEWIGQILGKEMILIEHIGSSAVPNLLTKPIIDILVVVQEIEKIDVTYPLWEVENFEVKGEFGIPYRRYFCNEQADFGVHVHIYDQFSKKEILRHLAVRNFLRTHPDICVDYSELKQQIINKNCNRAEYQQQKSKFIGAVEQLALVWEETFKIPNKN